MARTPIPTWYFVVVVVRRNDRFLVIQERKHGQLWYLPAGRVEPGESLVTAAKRETLEEAGISVVLDGVIRVEHLPLKKGHARLRVVFAAHCENEREQLGGVDSLQARWVTPGEAKSLHLRGEEVQGLIEYMAADGKVFPLTVLGREGTPYSSD